MVLSWKNEIIQDFICGDVQIAVFNRDETDVLFEHLKALGISWSNGDLEEDKYWGFDRLDADFNCILYDVVDSNRGYLNAHLSHLTDDDIRTIDDIRFDRTITGKIIMFSDIDFSTIKIEVNNANFIKLLNNI